MINIFWDEKMGFGVKSTISSTLHAKKSLLLNCLCVPKQTNFIYYTRIEDHHPLITPYPIKKKCLLNCLRLAMQRPHPFWIVSLFTQKNKKKCLIPSYGYIRGGPIKGIDYHNLGTKWNQNKGPDSHHQSIWFPTWGPSVYFVFKFLGFHSIMDSNEVISNNNTNTILFCFESGLRYTRLRP